MTRLAFVAGVVLGAASIAAFVLAVALAAGGSRPARYGRPLYPADLEPGGGFG